MILCNATIITLEDLRGRDRVERQYWPYIFKLQLVVEFVMQEVITSHVAGQAIQVTLKEVSYFIIGEGMEDHLPALWQCICTTIIITKILHNNTVCLYTYMLL